MNTPKIADYVAAVRRRDELAAEMNKLADQRSDIPDEMWDEFRKVDRWIGLASKNGGAS
jgi:hypothetical protein